MVVVSKYLSIHKVDDGVFFLLNTLTGAIDIADEETIKVLEKIKKGESYIEDFSLLNYLKERGHIFDSREEEIKLLNELYRKWEIEEMKSPLSFVVGVTSYCNFACKYCFEQNMHAREHEKVWNDAKINAMFEAMDKILKERKKEKATLILFGGEPLLPPYKDSVIKILEKAKERGFDIDEIITNGYYLSEYIPIIQKYDVKSVQVTLDGTEKIHNFLRPLKGGKGTFTKIVDGIDKAVRSGIPIVLRVNVNSYNIHNLPDLARYIKQMGWDKYPNFQAYLGHAHPYGSITAQFQYFIPEPEALKLVLEMYDRYPEMSVFSLSGLSLVADILSALENKEPFKVKFTYCSANTIEYAFDIDGKIYACSNAIGMKEFAIGQFYPSFYISKIMENKWRVTIFDKGPCKNCKYSLICGGGCIYRGVLSGKSFSDPLCHPIEETLKILFTWYYKKNKDKLFGKG